MTAITANARAGFDMGRVVKRTFSTVAADLPTFAVLALIFVAVPVGVQSWFQSQILESLTTGKTAQLANFANASSSILLCTLAAWLLNSLAGAASVKLAISRFEGTPLSLGEVIVAGLKQWPMVILINFLIGICVGLGLVLLIVPGIMLLVRWSAAIPARIAENLGPTASMGRSARLTQGRRMPIFGLMVALMLYLMAVDIVGSVVIAPIGLLIPNTHLAGIIVLPALLQLFVFPVGAAGSAAIYVELGGGTGPRQTADVFS